MDNSVGHAPFKLFQNFHSLPNALAVRTNFFLRFLKLFKGLPFLSIEKGLNFTLSGGGGGR
jgi:hypothetical protein